MRLLRVVVVLALLAVAGLSAYAYFGDMAPERREVRVPVSLTGGALPQTANASDSARVEAEAAPEPAANEAPAAPAADEPAGADALD